MNNVTFCPYKEIINLLNKQAIPEDTIASV
jgi:hypothetical protein